MKKWNKLDRPLILASGSPRRRELLAQMGLAFDVVVDSVPDEELYFRQFPVSEAIEKLVRAKADGPAERFPDSLVAAADTIVLLDGTVLGKPKDREDARRMIAGYSGREHTVQTCVSLECRSVGFYTSVTASTIVTFRKLESWEIESYLDTSHYFDKAGAYGIQDEAKLFAESVNGCYYNVVGFPVTAVISLFQKYQQWSSEGI